jgi:FSR family fosmidomycin resistance protein-like MFS transporter
MQSVIPAAYPILKNFSLNFTQIGLITFVYQLTASLLQPFIGFYTDKKPKPYSLAIGMVFTIWIDFIIDSNSVLDDTGGSFLWVLVHRYFIQKRHASLLGSGERGLAQSIFQLAVTLEVL